MRRQFRDFGGFDKVHDAASESLVDRDQRHVEDLREGDVLGVVGLGPAECLGKVLRGRGQRARTLVLDRYRAERA